MSQLFIALFAVINLLLVIYSVRKVTEDKEHVSFIAGWGFVIGAFVWEDLLVYGLLHFGLAVFALALHNSRLWLLCFLVFWLVRSAGETLYFFLQQFIEPKQYPHHIHRQLNSLRKLMGPLSDQKCFIIMQVFMQTITILSIIGLILLLRAGI